jgi:hypothetical protein
MEKIEKILEKYVIYVLLVLMAGIIVLATIDLVGILWWISSPTACRVWTS